MRDQYQREIDYVRISVTDRCNFRCRYCMPREGVKFADRSEIMTYEDAAEAYNTLTEKDRLSGGYARLFSDYMVIFLGILPVFLAVTRGLRDRRAMMQELIYTRRCSSFTVVTSRYLSKNLFN